jgi:putative peptidoglycan lipid II flippase
MTTAGRDGTQLGSRHSTSRLLQSSALIGVGTALSRITGFLRVAAVLYALGVTTVGGVYGYSNEIPNMVYELLLGGVLTATLVPQFVRHFQRQDDEAVSAVFTVAMLALLAVTVLGILLAPFIVDLYTLRVSGPGKAQQQELATSFLRCFMPQMVFYGLTALATAMLQARQRFFAPAFAPILNNLVVISIFLVLPQFTSRPITVAQISGDPFLLLFIGLGTTAGIAAMGLALLPALHRAQIHLRFLPAWRHAAVRTMVRLSGWTVGYVIANQVALFVVLVLANEERGGALVYLSAYAFFQLPHGLFAVSITSAVAPELAAAGARADPPALRHRFSRALRLMLTVIIPAAAIYVALARPIVVALLQRGAFDAADAAVVADTLVAFAIGLPFFSTYLFALRAFYSLEDTKTPFLINCVENAVNIALALALFSWLEIPGLGLAFSGAYAVATVLALFVLSRRIGGLSGRGIETSAAKVLAVSAAAGGVAWLVARGIGWDTTGAAIVTVVLGLVAASVVTVGGLRLLKVEEYTELAAILGPRLRRMAASATPWRAGRDRAPSADVER